MSKASALIALVVAAVASCGSSASDERGARTDTEPLVIQQATSCATLGSAARTT